MGFNLGGIKKWLLPSFLILTGVAGLGFGGMLPTWVVPVLAIGAGALALTK